MMERAEPKPMDTQGTGKKYRQRRGEHLFEVGYKAYYREISEHIAEHIRANNPEEALRKFCRMKKIHITTPRQFENMQWWEDEWLMSFRYVQEVVSIACPHCDGSGVTTSLPR